MYIYMTFHTKQMHQISWSRSVTYHIVQCMRRIKNANLHIYRSSKQEPYPQIYDPFSTWIIIPTTHNARAPHPLPTNSQTHQSHEIYDKYRYRSWFKSIQWTDTRANAQHLIEIRNSIISKFSMLMRKKVLNLWAGVYGVEYWGRSQYIEEFLPQLVLQSMHCLAMQRSDQYILRVVVRISLHTIIAGLYF